jgi:hypothetical protein
MGNKEQATNTMMREELRLILERPIIVESNDDETKPDGVIMSNPCGPLQTRTPMVIAEFKRTLGEGGCDPSIQAGNSMRAKLGQSEVRLLVQSGHNLATESIFAHF